MGFKYKVEPANEGVVDTLVAVGLLGSIYAIFNWWAHHDEKTQQPEQTSGSNFESLGNSVKRVHIEKLFKEIEQLPDNELNRVLDDVKIAATPQMLQTNIKLQQQLTAEYKKFNQARFSVLKAPIDDILNYRGSVKSALAALDARYYDNPVDHKYGWNCIPKEYEKLFAIIHAPCESKSLREYGWNKTNLRIIGQHIIHFGYTVFSLSDVVRHDTDKFEKECMRILKNNIKKLDWVDDPNDPDGMEQHVNDDEGPVSYLLGQQSEWLGWAFLDNSKFKKSAIGPHLGIPASISATLGICKVLKKDIGAKN